MPSLPRSWHGVYRSWSVPDIFTIILRFPTYSCAALHVESASRIPVVHCVEGSDLVDTHRRHLQDTRNLIHDADAGKAVLALAQVEQRHYRRLLVLAWIAAQDLLDELLILCVEFEGNVQVVLGGVAVLPSWLEEVHKVVPVVLQCMHTTLRLSLRAMLDTANVRRGCRVAVRIALALPLRAHGASLEAIVWRWSGTKCCAQWQMQCWSSNFAEAIKVAFIGSEAAPAVIRCVPLHLPIFTLMTTTTCLS